MTNKALWAGPASIVAETIFAIWCVNRLVTVINKLNRISGHYFRPTFEHASFWHKFIMGSALERPVPVSIQLRCSYRATSALNPGALPRRGGSLVQCCIVCRQMTAIWAKVN